MGVPRIPFDRSFAAGPESYVACPAGDTFCNAHYKTEKRVCNKNEHSQSLSYGRSLTP